MASTPRRALRRAVERQRCTARHTAAPTAARRFHGALRAQPPAQAQQERTALFPHFPFTLAPSHALPACSVTAGCPDEGPLDLWGAEVFEDLLSNDTANCRV